MKRYEAWEGDLYLGIFWEDEVNFLDEGNPYIRACCISD